MNSALDNFVRYLEAERRYSPLTVRNYRRDIERFFRWLDIDPATFDLDQIAKADIRNWMLHRTDDEGLSPRSMNRELSSLRAFFGWLRNHDLISRNPMAGIGILRTSRRLPAFVPETRMRPIVDACKESSDEFATERDALILLLFYTCGIRLAELVAIDCDDLSDDLRTLRVHGKGDKERQVPILEPVREKILHYLMLVRQQKICNSAEKALILSRKGVRISRSAIYRLVRQRLGEAGVQGKKSPHVLRHTFATHLLNSDADIREIQELLGHASLKATQVYAHNSIAHLRTVYENAHPRERMGGSEEEK